MNVDYVCCGGNFPHPECLKLKEHEEDRKRRRETAGENSCCDQINSWTFGEYRVTTLRCRQEPRRHNFKHGCTKKVFNKDKQILNSVCESTHTNALSHLRPLKTLFTLMFITANWKLIFISSSPQIAHPHDYGKLSVSSSTKYFWSNKGRLF